ncbi:hypothetical protein BGLY_0502 [Bacillus glycinifermentans]|nr:hypothetical protein BGLY_0502 [Bacillus glycinifermentans]
MSRKSRGMPPAFFICLDFLILNLLLSQEIRNNRFCHRSFLNWLAVCRYPPRFYGGGFSACPSVFRLFHFLGCAGMKMSSCFRSTFPFPAGEAKNESRQYRTLYIRGTRFGRAEFLEEGRFFHNIAACGPKALSIVRSVE